MAENTTTSGTRRPRTPGGKTAAGAGGKRVTKQTASEKVTKQTTSEKVTKKAAPNTEKAEPAPPLSPAVEPPEITADMALVADTRDSDFLDQANAKHNAEAPETQESRLADKEYLARELSRRELARRSYRRYLYYAHNPTWKRTHMSDFLADEVQRFVEEDTGNAYDILIIETPPQHGKLCADSTPVPTTAGWKRHGDLKPGDYVFSPTGKPIRVLAEIPQTQPADYRVTFVDGAQIKVHGAHEWVVQDRAPVSRRGRDITLETRQMAATRLYTGTPGRRGVKYRYSVAANACVEYPEAEQPLHPYFLGLWLGDGSTTKPCITHSSKDTEAIQHLVRLGYPVSTVCTHHETGVLSTYFSGRGSAELRELDFGHKAGQEKHIPIRYKIASIRQRLELLAGMIDSDGYVYHKNGRVTISNINKRLIDDFAEVVRSLGWRATVSAAAPVRSTGGVEGKHVCYQLTFNPDRDIPVQLPRKKLQKLNPASRRRAIISIEKCEPEPGKCITVEGGVYLVGSYFTPTHNSLTITESLPSWYLGRYPKNRIIEASYNDDTAKRFGRKNLEKVEQFGGSLFGLKQGSIWTKTEFELANGWGRMISRGIMSGITGNPANLLIIDDPIKNREEADSSVYREKLWGEWQNTLKSRLAAGAKVILIMTPWHEDDLAARILQREEHVRLIRLPVEAEEQDLLGRKPGDALAPELGKDNEWLRQFKQGYLNDPKQGGLRAWQALFQCSPRVEGGNLIRREWWRYYDPEEIKTFGTTVISVDAAFKDGDSNDFVAIQVWGKRGIDYYLRYSVNKHLDFPGTVEAIRTIRRLFPDTTYILIEDKANGSAIIQTLRKEFIGVIGLTPKGGKVARVNAVAPAIESGHVYLPKDSLWTEEFVDQFTAFPAAAHDDMVDACSQCIGFLLFSGGSGYLPEAKEEREERELEEASTELLTEGGYDVYGQDAGY